MILKESLCNMTNHLFVKIKSTKYKFIYIYIYPKINLARIFKKGD